MLVSGSALMGGCGDQPIASTSPWPSESASPARNSTERTLAVELTSAATGDAGMIFSIDGPNILGIEPAEGLHVVSHRASSPGRTTIDVLVAGPLASGVIAWLTVKGVHSGSPFTARVSQVAAGPDEGFVQRTDLSAYSLIVRR
jgi:hypothetical protein